MRPADVSGIVIRDAPFITVPIITAPEAFANVYSVQFPSRFLKWRILGPPIPPLRQTLTLISHLGQNVGLGEG